MMRKTKIMATLGPASDSPEAIEKLIMAGVDCFRINFSHVTPEAYEKTGGIIGTIRSLAKLHNRHIAVFQDLGGIKLRIGNLPQAVKVSRDQEVVLIPDEAVDDEQTDAPYRLPFPQQDILGVLEQGDRVYISDGTVCLVVQENEGGRVRTYARNGGTVSTSKGVNIPGVSVDRPALTQKDERDARLGVELGVDWVGISFVRTAHDVQEARRFLASIGSKAMVMAKIERKEGVDNIDSILPEVDGIMVARGDLGIELEMETVPRIQKELVHKANAHGVISVVATQMLFSMVNSPRPTRAETSDISTAVLDGVDGVLLSDEIAVGNYPVEAVGVADRTMLDTETIYPYNRIIADPGDTTRSVASAAITLADQIAARCIVVTSTGKTAIQASLCRHREPVIVLSHQPDVLCKLALVWGLRPVSIVSAEHDAARFLAIIVMEALRSGVIQENDRAVVVSGFSPGTGGTTNSIRALDLAEYLPRIRTEMPEVYEAAKGFSVRA